MSNCLFCKIIKGEIPCQKIYEDTEILAFNDINPKASTHILVIPKEHYEHIHEVPEEKNILLGKLMGAVGKIVIKQNLTIKGYKLLINSGPDAGQEVPHIHVHILGGKPKE